MELKKDHFPIHVEQALQWGEMDAFNHINNTVYFKFFENIRIKFMNESGIMSSIDEVEDDHIGPILAHTEASFRIPLTFPDTIRTYLRVSSIGNTSFTVDHIIWSKRLDKIACTGKSVTVLINYQTQKKVALPEWMRRKLESYSN